MLSYQNLHHFLSQFRKTSIVFICDLALTLIAIWFTQWQMTPLLFYTVNLFTQENKLLIITTLAIQAISYWRFGLYRGVWRFASIPDLIRIIKACVTGTLILAAINFYLSDNTLLPNLSLPLFCLFAICLLSSTRLAYRWYKDNRRKFLKTGKKVLVIGAGNAGEVIIRELNRTTNQDLIPIGFVDDNPAKLGLEIHGIRVLGNSTQLLTIVENCRIDLILIAIPTANSAQMRRVVSLCEQTRIPYRTLPNLNDIAMGKETITNIRHVRLEDLLTREPIQFNRNKLYECIGGKKILITGAGGSIGSELCRKIAECNPTCLILIEHSEFNLFQIKTELEQKFENLILYAYLISVTNKEMISQIMQQHKPDYVFHAAAYKHVPLLEPQVKVAIDNNIFGTEIVATAACENNVKKFILVSTDKAVNPNNVMGATKRCAEIICQCLNNRKQTRFTTVRFGNVLGSTGSVVPLFKQQIEKGGPVTITHPDMERYFMTIQEAAQLIITTVTINNPSDLYVLDMGEPVKIQYLAEQMIKLSGHRPDVDIDIVYTGLRPGEKINEKLFYDDENISHSDHEKILRVEVPPIDEKHYMHYFSELKSAFISHDAELRKNLFNLSFANNLENTLPTTESLSAIKKQSIPAAL